MWMMCLKRTLSEPGFFALLPAYNERKPLSELIQCLIHTLMWLICGDSNLAPFSLLPEYALGIAILN